MNRTALVTRDRPRDHESPPAAPTGTRVTESDIARRAFELYCDRGCEDGHDVEDWLTAERELRNVTSSSAA